MVTGKEYLRNIRVGDPKDKRRYSMSDFKKLAHAIWDCKYHIVWCPKYRFRILKGAVKQSVTEIIKQLCEWKKLEILEMNVQEDHVHLVISMVSFRQACMTWFRRYDRLWTVLARQVLPGGLHLPYGKKGGAWKNSLFHNHRNPPRCYLPRYIYAIGFDIYGLF